MHGSCGQRCLFPENWLLLHDCTQYCQLQCTTSSAAMHDIGQQLLLRWR
jgi:hypothetical protein